MHEGPVKGWSFPKAITLRGGKDIAILSCGGILTQAMDAAERLAEKGISARVVSFPCLKPLDTDTVKELLASFRRIITVEEHTIIGGFGSAVCELAAEEGTGCRVKRIGLNDCFTTVVGDRQYLREIYGMDGKAIADKAEAFLEE